MSAASSYYTDAPNSERDEKIAALEAKVEALSQQVNNLVSKIEVLVDHANYHTHSVGVGDYDSYGNNSIERETNSPSHSIPCE